MRKNLRVEEVETAPVSVKAGQNECRQECQLARSAAMVVLAVGAAAAAGGLLASSCLWSPLIEPFQSLNKSVPFFFVSIILVVHLCALSGWIQFLSEENENNENEKIGTLTNAQRERKKKSFLLGRLC
jgi:coenzyme F420-reducing hydrogenase gamma subunit